MRILVVLSALVCLSHAGKTIPTNFGRVCGFGDFNNDRNTDIIVQLGANLTVLLQDDKLLNVLEDGVFKNSSTFVVGTEVVECSLGDFNGDSHLDVLVSTKTKHGFKHTMWLAQGISGKDDIFTEQQLAVLGSQAMAIDVDGDGIHDVLGFHANGSMYCKRLNGESLEDCNDEFIEFPETVEPYPGMPHLYVDVIGSDLLAEIVFMLKGPGGYLNMDVWQRKKHGWSRSRAGISTLESKYVGAPVAADFDADRKIEILVPVCQEEACEHISHFAIWQGDRGWRNHTVDMGSAQIYSEPDSKVLMRVGDFGNDGYPDLLVTIAEKGTARIPRVLDNIPCAHCEQNDTRKFELKKGMFIQPREVALGIITMTSFFDLREDGTLDILVEYTSEGNGATKFTFIPCDDKGDTTFLKVQVFTCSCANRCNVNSQEPGSGISWGGSCMYFSMSDGWGGSLQSVACQIPAQTHRSLMAPYVLFGLGRSPNFVDELVVGTPRYDAPTNSPFRQHALKQIVPNSRIIMLPPKTSSSHWQNRLYVTPSQLIIQSLVVISVVCLILMIVVSLLHWREKKEDRVERQQQSHRFHFDAM